MKIQIAAIVLVTGYIGYLLAERTVTIDGPEGTQINVTFIGEYSYINDTAPGEHLEVPVRLEFFNIGETTPYNITYELVEGFIHGTEIMDDERNQAFEKLEEEKLVELKNTFESK